MRMFIIPKGTEVSVVKFEVGRLAAIPVRTVLEASFFLEDVTIDPLGHVGCGPVGAGIGNLWAQMVLMGFRLPKASALAFLPPEFRASGWQEVLVPMGSVEVL